jgi:hypothetical protein
MPLQGLLSKGSAQLAANGLKGARFILPVAAIGQQSTVRHCIKDEGADRLGSQGGRFVQIADDFASEHLRVVHVPGMSTESAKISMNSSLKSPSALRSLSAPNFASKV